MAGAAVAGLGGDAGPAGAMGLRSSVSLRLPDSLPHPHVPAGTDMLPDVEHVVILMMENHSFDDHFGRLGRGDGLKVAGDGTPLNYNPAADGGYILSFPMPNTAVPVDSQIGQNWNTSHLCWDHGTNMGFARACGPASMGHFTGAQLPFYYSLASHFPIGDRYFSSVMAQTYPNRRFLIAATALGNVATNSTGISSMDAPNGTIFGLRPEHVQHHVEVTTAPTCRRRRSSSPSSARGHAQRPDWLRSTSFSPMPPPANRCRSFRSSIRTPTTRRRTATSPSERRTPHASSMP